MPTALDFAVAAYHAQQHFPAKDKQSLRSITTQFGISTTTVSDQVSGRQLPSESLILPNRASQSLRRSLWLIISYICHSLDVLQHTRAISSLLKNSTNIGVSQNTPPLGKHWIGKLLHRHPKVVLVWTRSIDTDGLMEHAQSSSPYGLPKWALCSGNTATNPLIYSTWTRLASVLVPPSPHGSWRWWTKGQRMRGRN